MATFSPALGSRASVPSSPTFQFLAVADPGRLVDGAALEVWTNLSGEWREHRLVEHVTAAGIILVARVPVAGAGDFHFTYRIREASGNIVWLSKAAGNDNGYLVVRPADVGQTDFNPFLRAQEGADIQAGAPTNHSDISVRTIRYSLTDGQEGQVESFRMITLGGWSSGLTIERSKPTWFTSRSLDIFNGLSPHHDCQLLLYYSGSQVTACFPLSLTDASATLRGCAEDPNTVWLRSERETSGPAQGQCIVAWGPASKLVEVIDACIATAKEAINKSSPDEQPNSLANDHVSDCENSLHKTTKAVYCTWNSLGQDYTFSGVIKRLASLQEQGILLNFESLLLDDGWQDVAYLPENKNLRGLRSFGLRDGWLDEDIKCQEGESKLAAAIANLKKRFPDIKTVGVWMTLEGYWNGLHPDSEISRNYKLKRYGCRDKESQYPYPPPFENIYLPSPEDTNRYWVDYLTTLKQAGVDFVKIDNQAGLDYLVGDGAAAMRGEMSRTARKVAEDVFGPGNLINCMAGSPRYYNEFLSKRSPRAASLRTSDDFFPNELDSHRFHIAHNATTAFLDRKLAVTRDFDMFVTHHDFAEYHALLRCFSTAPMYITDSEPSNLKIFKRLGGSNIDREYQIVKALENTAVRLPSTAFTDVLGDGDGPALKVALPVPSANGAIVGIWNCRGTGGSAVDALTKQEIMEVLTLDKQDKRRNARYVIMYDVNSVQDLGSLGAEISEGGHGDIVMPVHLAAASCKTVTIAEIKSYSSFDLAVLGLGDKYVGLCAVTSIEEHKSTQMEEPSVPETVTVLSKVNGSERTASEETLRQSEDTTGPPEAALSEAAPLLPSKPTLAPARRGSRLLALLLFFRRDLSNARKAFFKDFFASPFRTLVREVRAVFGGPSTLPGANGEEERSSFGTSHQAPEMQETARATPKTYGTMSNGAVDTNHTTQHEGDLSLHSESSGATAVNELKTPDEVIVKLSVTGKAVFWIPDFALEHYRFTLQGQEVPEKMLEVSGDSVVLDLDSAVQDLPTIDAAPCSEGWQIGISKK